MLVAFLIMLREGIEAALIVGIVAGFLKQSGHSKLMPKVWFGVVVRDACLRFDRVPAAGGGESCAGRVR